MMQEQAHKSFPERCLRGLRDTDCLERDENGRVWVSMKAFLPHWPTIKDRVDRRHKSNHYESSINWEDHIAESFRILCTDPVNAKCGVASVLLQDIKNAKQLNPRASTMLDWEREPLPKNPFHGNLLFSGTLPRNMVRELAAVIATHVQDNLILIEPDRYVSELTMRNNQIDTKRERGTGAWRLPLLQRFFIWLKNILRR